MSPSRPHAFSVVELLVSLALVALLLALLTPTLARARDAARRAACMVNHRQFGMAFSLYAIDNRGFMPMPTERTTIGGEYSVMRWNQPINHGKLYQLYLNSNARVYYCPDFQAVLPAWAPFADPGAAAEIFRQSWNNNHQAWYSSYATGHFGSADLPAPDPITNPVRMPSMGYKRLGGKLANNLPPYAPSPLPILICYQRWNSSPPRGGGHRGEYSNILFADLSVSGLSYPFAGTNAYWDTAWSEILAAHGSKR